MTEPKDPAAKGRTDPKQDKAERLAQALRANLQRRKAQDRARKAPVDRTRDDPA